MRLQTWALDEEKAALLRKLHGDPPLAGAEVDAIMQRVEALQRERAALSSSYGRVGSRQAMPGPPDGAGA